MRFALFVLMWRMIAGRAQAQSDFPFDVGLPMGFVREEADAGGS